MNCRTGEILAMATYPTYDNNRYQEFSAEKKRIRPVTDIFEPGSIFKSFVLAACLEEGLLNENDMIDCEDGAWSVSGRVLHDCHAYSEINVEKVIIKSSNIGAAKMGIRLGQNRLYDYIQRFGFGNRTGIPIPGEATGILRPLRQWSRLSISSIPMGQEIGTTMIQMVTAYSAIANGGILLRPVIAKSLYRNGERVHFPQQPKKRIISKKTAARVLAVLEKVVQQGTGRKAISMEYNIAGKTGTAQKAGPGGYSKNKYIGSFMGIAPVENPLITVLVSVDEPQDKHYGGTVAAPAVRAIVENTLNYLDVPHLTDKASVASMDLY
jgi:cell division protein FtsI (penicillin-binding protein 3)